MTWCYFAGVVRHGKDRHPFVTSVPIEVYNRIDFNTIQVGNPVAAPEEKTYLTHIAFGRTREGAIRNLERAGWRNYGKVTNLPEKFEEPVADSAIAEMSRDWTEHDVTDYMRAMLDSSERECPYATIGEIMIYGMLQNDSGFMRHIPLGQRKRVQRTTKHMDEGCQSCERIYRMMSETFNTVDEIKFGPKPPGELPDRLM